MAEVFLKLMNMSITAGYLVVAVLLARLFLRKSPKWISCLLWGIVALRLVLPFTVESPLSLIPSAEVIPQNIATSYAPAIQSGIPLVNSTINPMMTQGMIQSGNVWQDVLSVAAIVWLVGMAAIFLYGIVSYGILRWQIRACVKVQDGVYICDDVSSPFIFGFFRPKIYLPSGLDPETTGYVLLHEKIHLRRKDHWWKPLGYCLLAVYWFNPLLWVAYILLCRDIEQSCDEKVISQMSVQEKQGYSLALVSCSRQRRMITVCPVAFGQVSVSTRIKAIVSYKKPSFWILLCSIVLCAAISVCFLTNPETCLHVYANEVVTPATCTQMGIASHTCRLCEYTYTEPLAKCAHTDSQLTIIKEPTCSTVGTAFTVCTCCGEEYTVELPVIADAHHLEERVVREATCTEAGEGVIACTLCSYAKPVTYELVEHIFEDYIFYDNTCKNHSYREWYCSVCGYMKLESLSTYGSHEFIFGRCRWCGMMQAGYRYGSYNTSSSDFNSSGLIGDTNKSPEVLLPVIEIFPNPGPEAPSIGFPLQP